VFVHDRDADADGVFDEDPRSNPGAVATTRVSVSSSGEQSNGASVSPSISANGRYVAFSSWASNLVESDTQLCEGLVTPEQNCADAFVHDRLTGTTMRVSVTPAGNGGNGDSADTVTGAATARISANGRHVAFTSYASDLVPGDDNGMMDVFVRDLVSGKTTRIAVSTSGREADGESGGSIAISRSGRYVAFSSDASNLVQEDTNENGDVFVHDRDEDGDGVFDEPGAISTIMASVSSTGQQGRQSSAGPAISDGGRYVAFLSVSSNLVPDDTNGEDGARNIGVDLFLRDLRRGVTIRVSVSSEGRQSARGGAAFPATPGMSADGRVLAWDSESSDLTEEDQHPSWDVFVRRLAWRPG
jgi:Tol biopolymer transport system component